MTFPAAINYTSEAHKTPREQPTSLLLYLCLQLSTESKPMSSPLSIHDSESPLQLAKTRQASSSPSSALPFSTLPSLLPGGVPVHTTIFIAVIYAVVFSALLVTDQLPSMPKHTWGLDFQHTYRDLYEVAARPHPFNSHANVLVRSHILSRVQDITLAYNYVSVDFDASSIDGSDKEYKESGGLWLNAHWDCIGTAPVAADDGIGVMTLLSMVECFAENRPSQWYLRSACMRRARIAKPSLSEPELLVLDELMEFQSDERKPASTPHIIMGPRMQDLVPDWVLYVALVTGETILTQDANCSGQTTRLLFLTGGHPRSYTQRGGLSLELFSRPRHVPTPLLHSLIGVVSLELSNAYPRHAGVSVFDVEGTGFDGGFVPGGKDGVGKGLEGALSDEVR
ncbi:hypothetical protein EDB19DRAFT_1836445 [Suillus lakei]|nr:hypothetical protein EDB19DRAFT_1836445 [Suillus lakei]